MPFFQIKMLKQAFKKIFCFHDWSILEKTPEKMRSDGSNALTLYFRQRRLYKQCLPSSNPKIETSTSVCKKCGRQKVSIRISIGDRAYGSYLL